MAGQDKKEENISVEELEGLDAGEQGEVIAAHYASISNLYDPVKREDFSGYLDEHKFDKPPNISPYKVQKAIKKMKKSAATIPGDLPMKIISLFSDDLNLPLSHIINSSVKAGKYPVIWKN